MEQYYYQLKDESIWSTELAEWVSPEDVPADIVLNRLYQDGQPAGVDYLIAVLNEYGYDLGELAKVLYVDAENGDDTNNGGSPDQALKTIQAAADKSSGQDGNK